MLENFNYYCENRVGCLVTFIYKVALIRKDLRRSFFLRKRSESYIKDHCSRGWVIHYNRFKSP